MVRRIASGLGIVGCAVLLGLSVQVDLRADTSPTAASAASVREMGKEIFEGKGNCWVCHGREGKGSALGPDLTDNEWLASPATLEGVAEVIRVGVARPERYPAPMPPMGGAQLTAAEVDAVATYVFGLSAEARAATP